jgi:hypothetical protein
MLGQWIGGASLDGSVVKYGSDGRFEDDQKHNASTLRKYAKSI